MCWCGLLRLRPPNLIFRTVYVDMFYISMQWALLLTSSVHKKILQVLHINWKPPSWFMRAQCAWLETSCWRNLQWFLEDLCCDSELRCYVTDHSALCSRLTLGKNVATDLNHLYFYTVCLTVCGLMNIWILWDIFFSPKSSALLESRQLKHASH